MTSSKLGLALVRRDVVQKLIDRRHATCPAGWGRRSPRRRTDVAFRPNVPFFKNRSHLLGVPARRVLQPLHRIRVGMAAHDAAWQYCNTGGSGYRVERLRLSGPGGSGEGPSEIEHGGDQFVAL
jgi:hypothetical protein